VTDFLTQVSILRLTGVMLIVLLPHFWNIPAWEVAFILATLGWRTLAALRQWMLPRSLLRALLTVLAVAGVYASYGNLSGQNAGTALLAVMAALKLLEMRSRRDVMITVFLLYFVLLTHFLLTQEMWTIVYLGLCMVAITALLLEVSHAKVGTPEPLPIALTLRMGGAIVLYAVPLMLLLFVLFPRIPGPLWGLPSDSGAERSGLPDSMSPGNIADLILSDEPAFRVQFEGPPPAARDLYWRGPVFDVFDGRSWKADERYEQLQPPAEYEGTPIAYEVTLEPVRTRWLMALDLPDPQRLPPGAYLGSGHQLATRTPVRDRRLYSTRSYPRYRLQPVLPPWQQERNLQLPRFGNSGAHALARQWRQQGLDDAQIAQAALRMFREEQFFYTLKPPRLGENSIDEFLFETRRGFCEHYSSAFAFLMRAAGIPARVVIGFQGCVKNPFGDYYIVSHSDAHAWNEIWLPQRGWVRIDPTGAVAPERIENGIERALGAAGELPAFLQRRGDSLWVTLEARWDWLNNQWNYWVLAYGPELQASFLSQFGIRDWSGMILALTILGTLMLAVIGALLMRQYRTADTADAALRLWRRAQKVLARHGLVQRPHEGPRDFARRVAEELPPLREPMEQLLSAYLRARYLGLETDSELRTLKTALARLR
jgi:protein-glutamine gamma-glutamyltransferase